MNAMSERVDAYAHLGLPRFITLEQYIHVMDRHGIHKAFVAAADTCPDLHEVSRASAEYPERFRSVGVPQGDSLAEIRASFVRQAQHGFVGIRIFDRTLAEFPELLNVMADLNLIPWVVGGAGLASAAACLVDYLEGGADRRVVAPHFGGAAAPEILNAPGAVRDLFSHPRMLVIFSRHGAYEPNVVRAWAGALIAHFGWGRILFGSEFPVCLWRNESYQSTLDWAKTLDALLDADAFYGENALQHLWNRPVSPPRILEEKRPGNLGEVILFPPNGMRLPEEENQVYITRYLCEALAGEGYQEFLARTRVSGAG